MAERTDRVGLRFGDYWLRRRLGGGGFGDVYLGEHVQTKSLAAIKVLHIRLTRSEDLRAFINEVRTFRLQHPHIVRVLDVGIASDETPFLVMEYAPNGTLRDRHPKGTRLLLSTVLAYVAPLASALQYAHDLQLVHRDVKPENMLLGAGEVLWLSDFGIATVAHSTGSLTTEGMGGTLPYMAPEQIQGRPRPQSDQYALAIVVYEWLTGTWPFRGTPIEIAMQQQMTPPPPLRPQVPTLPVGVEQVVLTALSKNPKERFGTIQAFATALVQAAQSPLEQSASPETAQQALSTTEHLQSAPTVEAAESEWQQASASHLTGPHTTGAFPAPSTANIVRESSPGFFSAPSERVPSSATPSPSLPDTLSRPSAEPSPTSGIADVSTQAAAIAPPSPAPRQTKRRLSPAVTVFLILLALILLGGVSFAIYHGVTTSPWTAQTSGTSTTLGGVAWSGSQFVAVGDSGTILTSLDGYTWTAQTSGTSVSLFGVAGSGSQFVAVGGDGFRNGIILTSPDGRTWTTQYTDTTSNLDSVVWSGSQFVVVGLGGTILTSPDGRTWTTQNSGTSISLGGVAWSGSQFVAVGLGGTILTSP